MKIEEGQLDCEAGTQLSGSRTDQRFMQSKQEEEMEEMLKVLKSLEEVMRTTRSQGLFQTSQDTKHQALMVSSLGVGLSINCAVPYPSLRPPNVLGCIHPPPSHSTGATLRAVDA